MIYGARKLHLAPNSWGRLSGVLKIMIGLSMAFVSSFAGAGVYKCENALGQVAYQAKPCASTSSQSTVLLRNTRSTSETADLSSPPLPEKANVNGRRDSSFQVYDQSGKPQLKIADGNGGWVFLSLLGAERFIAQRKRQLEQAKNCDAQREEQIERWEKKKEANLKAALADCERRRNSYCNSRDPQKIVELYNKRNNPQLDLGMNKDPVETGMRVARMNENKRFQEMRLQQNLCAPQGTRDIWQKELDRYQKAVAAAK